MSSIAALFAVILLLAFLSDGNDATGPKARIGETPDKDPRGGLHD